MTKLGRPNIIGAKIIEALKQSPGLKFAPLFAIIGGDKPRSLSSIIYRMLEDGVIFSAGPTNLQRHYFAREDDAKDWDDAQPESVNRRRARQRAYQRKRYAKNAVSKPPTRPAWSAEHDQIIRDHYPTKGGAYVAELIGKRVGVVRSRAGTLGVKNLVSTRNGVPYVKHEKASGVPVKAPVRGPAHLAIPADESRAVRLIHPTPEPRFHVPENFRGMFSQIGVGRDLVTGAAWGAA